MCHDPARRVRDEGEANGSHPKINENEVKIMNGLMCENMKLTLGKDLVADTTAETDTAVEDMTGFDEITWFVLFGDVDPLAVITFAVKENTASSTSSPTPTAIALTALPTNPSAVAAVLTSGNAVATEASANLDDKIVAITVRRQALTKQYCFLAITATVESYEIDKILCVKRCAHSVPVSQGTDVALIATAAA